MKKFSYIVLGIIFFVRCSSDPEKKETLVKQDSVFISEPQPATHDSTSIYADVSGPDLFPVGSKVFLFEDNTDLLKSPSPDGAIVATLRIGTALTITNKTTSRFTNDQKIDLPWYEVEFQKSGLKQTGFVWGGYLSIASATLNSPSGKNQILLTGLDYYEEPGMYGGGFNIKAKLAENFKTLSTVIFSDDIGLNMMETVDANELKIEVINTDKLENLKTIFAIYNSSLPKFKNQLTSKSFLFIANGSLNHYGRTDSLFVPEHPKGKENKLIAEHYNWENPQKKIIHYEHDWNGIGIVSETRKIFRDPVKLYSEPDLRSPVSATLHSGDSVITYRGSDEERVLKGLEIKGVAMQWVHASLNSDGKLITGYVWYGNLVFTSQHFVISRSTRFLGSADLYVSTGIKSVNSNNDANYEIDIKLKIDTVQFPLIPVTFVTCGGEEGGPYIFPEISLVHKNLNGIQCIVRLYKNNGCEGGNAVTEIYLFYDGKKWHSIKLPAQNYDLKYELIFPEDKNGKENKILMYKITGWPDNEIRTLYKKYSWDGNSFK